MRSEATAVLDLALVQAWRARCPCACPACRDLARALWVAGYTDRKPLPQERCPPYHTATCAIQGSDPGNCWCSGPLDPPASPRSGDGLREAALPFPDDAGPRCDACKGRGWLPGDCHPREVCGACNGTGYPKSWAAEEIARLDAEVAALRSALSSSPRSEGDGGGLATVETRPSRLPGFIWKRIALGWWGLFAPADVHAGDVWDTADNNRRAWEEHEKRRAARGIPGAPEPYDADADMDPFVWHTWDHRGIGGENASDRTRDAAMRSVEAALVRQDWHGAAPSSPAPTPGTEGGKP